MQLWFCYFSSCILLPDNVEEEIIETMCSQIDAASKKLGIEVIGGHSEVMLSLKQPVIVGSCIGISEDDIYVTSGGSEEGNLLIITKGAGIEGTAILASEKYDVLKTAVEGATFLLNSPYSLEKTWDEIPKKVQQQIIDLKLKMYVIDAYKVARLTGMGARVNTIMQTCFFAISGILPRDEAIAKIKDSIKNLIR